MLTEGSECGRHVGGVVNTPGSFYNTVGTILFDEGDGGRGASPVAPNGILYIQMLNASTKSMWRTILDSNGDPTTWEYMAAVDDLPATPLAKMWLCPITGEVFRGSCEGNYVHPPRLDISTG